jgi:hypothetical protein
MEQHDIKKETVLDGQTSPRVLLVGCGKAKHACQCPAEELYRGCIFQDRRTYAKGTGFPWFILSAKWYVIEPTREIEPYDQQLKDWSPEARLTWGNLVWGELMENLLPARGIKTEDKIIFEVHAGAMYADYVERAFEFEIIHGLVEINHITKGMGNGKTRQFYRKLISEQRRTKSLATNLQ